MVAASWLESAYAALFCEEAPYVGFNDLAVHQVAQQDCRLPIDPCYLEVCEPNTLEVFCSCPEPLPIGMAVDGLSVVVKFAEQRPERTLRLALRFVGVRKGSAGVRFPARTKADRDRVEKHLNEVYYGR